VSKKLLALVFNSTMFLVIVINHFYFLIRYSLYGQFEIFLIMKKIRLLSIVFSLIIITGVTAGNAAFAESDKYTLEDRLENFCNMTNEEKRQFFADHPRIAQFKDRLANFCELSEDEREVAIEVFIEKYIPEARDNESYDLDDVLDRFCEMSDTDKKILSQHMINHLIMLKR
jgi:hypothetical protein